MTLEAPPVVCLLGPTASGKTAVASELLKYLDCRLVSVDSAQVYKRMDIGSAKPSAQELLNAPHALIDIREPWQTYSAADFCEDAVAEINSAKSDGQVAVLVGGTMMYFRSLLQGLAALPAANPQVRQQIAERASRDGWQAVHSELATIDPLAAERIHPNDPQRIQRAMEVYLLTGETISDRQKQSVARLSGNLLKVGLVPDDRAHLHQSINLRFDTMLERGLIDEVTTLQSCSKVHRELPSQRCVGYRQVWDYLCDELSDKQLPEKGKAATRQLAKRQLTWMRSMKDLVMYDPQQKTAVDIASDIAKQVATFNGNHV